MNAGRLYELHHTDAFTRVPFEGNSAGVVLNAERVGSDGFHVFTRATEISGVLTECRMFAPAIGIAEDPVTGNGNGPLGAYLVRHRLARRRDPSIRFPSGTCDGEARTRERGRNDRRWHAGRGVRFWKRGDSFSRGDQIVKEPV